MTENKCPCCKAHISEFPDSGFYECDCCPFMCALVDFPVITAAMALVEAVKKEHLAFDALDDAGFQLGAVGMPIWTDHAAARAEVDRLLQEPPC